VLQIYSNEPYAYATPTDNTATVGEFADVDNHHITAIKQLTLEGHTKYVQGVEFSPDGKRVATGSADGTAKVWDAATGQELLTLKVSTNDVSAFDKLPVVNTFIFSPDGNRFVTVGAETSVWDVANGQQLLTLEGGVSCLAFHPGGKRLATGGVFGLIRVWDVGSGRELYKLYAHKDCVTSLAFSPDGTRLASASDDKTAKVWDTEFGAKLLTLIGHSDRVWSVAFSPDGARLATGSFDNTVRVWDARGQEPLTRYSTPNDGSAANADLTRLVWWSRDGNVRITEVVSGKEIRAIKAHADAVSCVAFSPDGTRIVSAGGDGTLKVWDVVSGRELLSLKGHTSGVQCVAFSPDGKRIATGGGEKDPTTRVWDAANGRELVALKGVETAGEQKNYCLRVTFSPDSERLATWRTDQTAIIWDLASGKVLHILAHSGNRSPEWKVGGVAFSRDGTRLATAGDDGTARVWDSHTGQELLTLRAHWHALTCVEFSHDGMRLVTECLDGTVKVWESHHGQELLTLRGPGGGSVKFSQEDRHMAAFGRSSAIIWDASPREE
jgi:WD40 repeat protein